MTRLGWLSCFGVLVLVACTTTNDDSAKSKKSKDPSTESESDDDDDDDTSSTGDDEPPPGDDADDDSSIPKTDAAAEAEAGGSGAVCTFNRDCPASERCECDEETGCFCHTGARGTGKNGVTECTTGNDCETALCVPGNDGKDYCSDECTSAAGCKSKLPLCSEIALLGKVCIRQKI